MEKQKPQTPNEVLPNKLALVTIDGPAGVGKTTLARLLATHLGVSYLDTGAMFRTLALKLGEKGSELTAEELTAECAKLNFALEGLGEQTTLLCNQVAVGQEIRTEKIALLASNLAKKPEIRSFLCQAQRELGAKYPLVCEGRDMGTVVFPEACCKFFLEATAEVRAKRRLLDQKNVGEKLDLATLAAQIRLRDEQDRTRAIAPLIPAKDAYLIDTSTLSLKEVLDCILKYLEQSGAAKFFPNKQAN